MIDFRFSSLEFLTVFCKSNGNKILKLIFYNIILDNLNSKKKGKEANTNFVLFSWSRNIIVRFMKTYFHRPINIVKFHTWEISKKFNLTLK